MHGRDRIMPRFVPAPPEFPGAGSMPIGSAGITLQRTQIGSATAVPYAAGDRSGISSGFALFLIPTARGDHHPAIAISGPGTRSATVPGPNVCRCNQGTW